jgi:hypothetical protein
LRARAPLQWPCAKISLEVGESWCWKSCKERQLISGEEVPVLLLPCCGESLVAREAQRYKRKERALGDQESHHLTIVRDFTVARKEKSGKRKWPQRNFTHDHASAATEEHHINLIKGGTIGAETEWR